MMSFQNISKSWNASLSTRQTPSLIWISGWSVSNPSALPMSPGGILSDKVLAQDGTQFLTTTINGKFEWAFNFLFTDRPLIAISDDNRLFSARTEEFLIKVFAPDGEYLYAFYYPYQRVRLTRHDALGSAINEYHQNIIRHAELPNRWPALHSMLVDDQNRLWVSTIVDDDDVYEWWVLQTTGEVIAKFEWPRDEPVELVKNGYLYTRETDELDLISIVRYRIEMEEK